MQIPGCNGLTPHNRRRVIDVYRWDPGLSQLTQARLDALATLDSSRWLWVDLQGEDTDSVMEVAETLGIDPGLADEAVTTARLPHVEEGEDSVLVVLHGFVADSGGRLVTAEINLFVTETFVLSLSRGAVPVVESLKGRLGEVGSVPAPTPAGLVAAISDMLSRRLLPLIQELEDQLDSLEEKAIRGDPETAVQVHALRRDVIFLRRALDPQFGVYDDLSHSEHPAIDESSRRALVRVANKHRRALESLEAGRALLGSVLETYRGAVNDQTNEIMRILTVFSAIMLPLGLVAGIWGMNFARMPGTEMESGFWWLLGGMVVVAVGVWVYFARRGFIGAPRVRDLPRAVGLGLVTITVAPVKAVAEGLKQLGQWED